MTQVRNKSGGNLQLHRFRTGFVAVHASSRIGGNRLARRRVRPDDENLQLRNYN
jgi:hypothetical protein